MLTARIEAGQREECVAVGEAVGVKSEVCEALLAVVEDLAVVLLVGPRHVVVVIEEGAVRVLQLGEDGELLEVSRRLGRDVDQGLEVFSVATIVTLPGSISLISTLSNFPPANSSFAFKFKKWMSVDGF